MDWCQEYQTYHRAWESSKTTKPNELLDDTNKRSVRADGQKLSEIGADDMSIRTSSLRKLRHKQMAAPEMMRNMYIRLNSNGTRRQKPAIVLGRVVQKYSHGPAIHTCPTHHTYVVIAAV